jgi:hypothetical protein
MFVGGWWIAGFCMTIWRAHQSKDPDILVADVALRRAARRAREIGRKTDTPVYVLRSGRIVDLTAEWKRQTRSR